MRKCALPARPSHELDPISAMSWGGEPDRRDQQGKPIIRMQGVYTIAGEIASGKKLAINGRLALLRMRRRRCGWRATTPDYLSEKFAQILFALCGLTLLE
jgi:hypothetical protein